MKVQWHDISSHTIHHTVCLKISWPWWPAFYVLFSFIWMEAIYPTDMNQFSSVTQSRLTLRLHELAAPQASLSITNSRSSLRLMSIKSVMPSSQLILCHPLLLLPPIPPSIRVYSDESTLRMRWPSTGVSALASFLPKKSQGWSPSEWTGNILGTYQPGEFIFQCHIFLPFHTVYEVLKARTVKWLAIPFSSGPRFVRILHHYKPYK